MFKRLGDDEINLFARIFIPVLMLVHLINLPYMEHLVKGGFIQQERLLFGAYFKNYFNYAWISFCLLGFVFFLKPKVLLPLCVMLLAFIQGVLYNIVEWHDLQVSFFVLTSLCVYYWKPDLFKNVPIRKLVLLFLSMQFLGASVSKLKDSGLLWMDGEVLRFTLLKRNIFYNNSLGYSIAQSLPLCRILSVIALSFQASFPLCLFFEKLEKFYVFSSVGFILFVYFVMNINLGYLAPSLLVFLPWENILALKQKLFKTSLFQ